MFLENNPKFNDIYIKVGNYFTERVTIKKRLSFSLKTNNKRFKLFIFQYLLIKVQVGNH